MALTLQVGCQTTHEETPPDPTRSTAAVPSAPASSAPAAKLDLLYLPDGGDRAPPDVPRPDPPKTAPLGQRCPPDMVDIGGAFCIDRYEAVLEDLKGRRLSPYYHPTRSQAKVSYDFWERHRSQSASEEGRAMPILAPPAWQLLEEVELRALVRPGEIPHGYQSGSTAEQACSNAGKRLCTEMEWVTACRGERMTKFPYGDEYQEGRCNVFREAHPAQVLHNDPSVNHLDPRLNQVAVNGRPLLRPTGTTPQCRSPWGDDAVYDMVGNLDEWVDDPEGAFLGGFYARGTREGCDQRISSHPFSYFDYSLGIRCCR